MLCGGDKGAVGGTKVIPYAGLFERLAPKAAGLDGDGGLGEEEKVLARATLIEVDTDGMPEFFTDGEAQRASELLDKYIEVVQGNCLNMECEDRGDRVFQIVATAAAVIKKVTGRYDSLVAHLQRFGDRHGCGISFGAVTFRGEDAHPAVSIEHVVAGLLEGSQFFVIGVNRGELDLTDLASGIYEYVPLSQRGGIVAGIPGEYRLTLAHSGGALSLHVYRLIQGRETYLQSAGTVSVSNEVLGKYFRGQTCAGEEPSPPPCPDSGSGIKAKSI